MTKTEKLVKLAEAANALEKAVKALREVQNDKTDNHHLCEDARYYADSIAELLSCDHGQGGLDALIRSLESRL
jgi:hypothetical protein